MKKKPAPTTRPPKRKTPLAARSTAKRAVGHTSPPPRPVARKPRQSGAAPSKPPVFQSDKLFRTLIENNSDSFALVDARGNTIYRSPSAISMWGSSDLADQPNNFFDRILPEDEKTARRVFAEILKSPGKKIPFQIRVRGRDGNPRWIDGIGVNRFAEPEIQAVVTNYRDLTEKILAAKALEDSEKRYRNLFESARLAIFQSTPAGKILQVNNEFARMFGYLSPEDVFQSVKNIATDLYVDPSRREEILRLRKKDPSLSLFENLYRRKDGGTFWGRLYMRSATDAQGAESYFEGFIEDITKNRAMEEALRESEERYRLLFELSPDSIAVYQEGKVFYANPSTLRLLGLEKPEEIIGKPMLDFVHPDYRKLVIERSRQQEANGKPASPVEEKFIRRDGNSVDVEVLAAPFQFRGKPSHLVISRDITERKRADEMLREKEERFRATFENASVGVCIVGLDGALLQVNRPMCEMFGYSREELERMTVNTIAHPEDAGISPAFIHQAIAGEVREAGFDKRYIHKDGHVLWGHVSSSLVRDSNGNPVYFVSHLQDISESKRAQEALRSLNLRHEALLSAIPEIVMEVDKNKIYTWANPAGMEFFGEDAIGKEADFYFEGEQETYEKVQPLFDGNENTVYLESWQRRKDGQKRLLAWWCRTLKDDHDNVAGALSSARDITEQRMAEEKIENLSRFPEENPNPVMRMTPEGALIYANKSSLPLLTFWNIGLGQTVPGECGTQIRDTFASRQTKTVETHMGERIFRCTVTPVVDAGYVNIYARDVTDRRKAEAEVARQTEELRQRNQELARLNALTERRMQQLAAMRTVDMAISSSFKSELVMDILLEQLTSQLRIHAADILIYHPAMQGFRFLCGRGFYSTPLSSEYLRLTDSYAGRATQERRMVKVPRLDEKADQPKIFPKIAKEGFVAYICLPLIAKGQIKGVMEICHREALELGPEEDSFLEMMAGQAAIAVDNSEMFEHLQSSRDELQLAFNSTLTGWAHALELRDHESEGETQRGADLAMRLAQTLGENENDLTNIYRGAILHDVGMTSVPDGILLKPGPLTSEEWTIVRQHPQVAFDILSPVLYLRPSLDIPHCHHERWNGSGYPLGYQGEHIPLAARIFAVVDVWSALRSDRPYRKAWTEAKAGEYLRSQSGKLFDPAVVQAFFRLIGG
jgi:PAS domain S-box-containing protein